LSIYEKRALEADVRIGLLRDSLSAQLSQLPESSDHPSLCIYATGSLARKEATQYSDLDAFFLLSDDEKEKPLGRIRDVRILNAVLNAQETAGFPDFSNDGAYLKFLYIDDVVKCIGHRDDDYKNAFTARMLLLTESTFLYNSQNFQKFRDKIVEVYFSDFHNHSTDFRPIFLLNDILRFWRTLCLNYENSRHWRDDDDKIKRAKGHLDNLKLKFSRLNICYSFIAHLLSQGVALSRDNAIATSNLTPFERLCEIEQRYPDFSEIVKAMLVEYSWFLETTDKHRDDALYWISNENNRIEAFEHAGRFVSNTGTLVQKIAEENGYLRYLIV
jgi:predicted nucleotidyltransferase